LKERQKGREDETEDVSSYWMTQRGNCLLKHLIERMTGGTRRCKRRREQLLDDPERELPSKTPHRKKDGRDEKVRNKM
jgi:hypothetical protein